MEAIEQSSTHTSDFVSSPHITIHSWASLIKCDPCSFACESCLSTSGSSTKINVQGLMPREDGHRSNASFMISWDCWSIAFFSYFLMLRLDRKISIMVSPQKKIE